MNHIELRFSALLKNEALARVAISSFVAELNPTIEELIEIKTLVSEAVSNAIIHGYKLDEKRDVYLKARIINKTLELDITDYGVGIKDLDEILNSSYKIDEGHEHAGMGIIIMKSLSDSFDIHSTLGLGTKVEIKKVVKSSTNNKNELNRV